MQKSDEFGVRNPIKKEVLTSQHHALRVALTKRTGQLKRALGAVIPALRKKFIAVHIALHAHGIAALHKGEETALWARSPARGSD